MLDCIITVKGTGVSREGSAGNTTRPVRDQTRPVHGFFKAFHCYGIAVRDHIKGCDKCTPEAALPYFQTAPATMRPDRVIKHMLRNDPRTPRLDYILCLRPLPENVVWASKFCSGEELWAFCRSLVAHWNNHYKQYPGFKDQMITSAWFINSRDKTITDRWIYKAQPATDVVKPSTRGIVDLAMQIHRAGGELPETLAEAKKLLPAAIVHGS